MTPLPAPPEQVVSTTGTLYQWVDTPMSVALVFGLAGAVFLGIYFIRRIRSRGAIKTI
jgi:hypothetical protein